MTEQERQFIKAELDECRTEAEEMGITLQEYLLLRILGELQQIPYRGES